MRRLIDRAVDEQPDGIVVTIPDARVLGRSIRRAVQAGIPVVSMNSGSEDFKRPSGSSPTSGRPRSAPGGWPASGWPPTACATRCASTRRSATARSTRAAARSAVRCARSAAARACWRSASRTAGAPRARRRGGRRRRDDGILALGPGSASPRSPPCARAGHRRVKLATFDLSPEVLSALKDGQLLFAIDQQPYLQGYLPVMMLAQNKRFGLFPSRARWSRPGRTS